MKAEAFSTLDEAAENVCPFERLLNLPKEISSPPEVNQTSYCEFSSRLGSRVIDCNVISVLETESSSPEHEANNAAAVKSPRNLIFFISMFKFLSCVMLTQIAYKNFNKKTKLV